ncbi:hypothetical protein [Lysinibacillus sp. Ag94]|uniref:hypothetical protein n=1 Tax=Lysinibacillus sp. Ag94 TaxID=2936682 RepID=UPI00200C974B|nr:hypothetical protein [Lysinibacillus sp. Ag94]UPW84303.1 hypothetical protein MY533_05375 [Lysinibacillus sp. Ag94]
MKIFRQNENGYSLLVTFAVIIIFTILGLSLITLTSSGITKNNTREELVQAQDLSDKGIDYAVKDIQALLEKEIKDRPMGKAAFESFLVNTLTAPILSCSQGINIPAENNNKTHVCIEKVELMSNEEKDRYKRLVTFKSTGRVNSKEHITYAQIIIGTDAIPDQLRYAVSTNDEGNLYLHGGVEIQGDIKTDGHLIISEKAHWLKNNVAQWPDSVFPRIIPDSKSVTPKIIMRESEKNIYYVNNTVDYPSHISGNTNYLNSSRYTKFIPSNPASKNELQKRLFLTKNVSLVTKSLPGDNLEITEKVIPLYTNKNYNKNYPSGLSVSYTNHETSKFNRDNITFIHGEKKDCNIFGCKKTLDRGNFNINGSGKTLNLSGTYFINGDFIVNNTNLRSDAMLYVNGNVDIKDSTLNGINSNSTLFIFATGDISISNISVDSATPSMIKGFFYSKQNMIMYGVGSNINLYGGISAKRTILTAVRGNSYNYTYESSKNQKETVITNGVEVPKRNSRLKITYDENLISQYTSFKRDEEEEFITELNEPETINRY